MPVVAEVAVLSLALAAAACGSSIAANRPSASHMSRATPFRVGAVFRTDNPQVFLAPIDESTTDSSDPCFVTYRFTTAVHGKSIRIEKTRKSPTTAASSPACAAPARPALQKLRLPVALQGRHLIDAADGQRINVLAALPTSYASVKPVG